MMKKLMKILLYVFGGLAVLIVAAVLIAPRLIDVQKYKPLLVEKVSAATGRPVSLGGDLNLSLFPWVGISFTDLQLGNPEGYEVDNFVRVQSFEAHVKVMPLLSKEVQIDRFVLDGPEIYLERKRDGNANWQGLGGKTTEKTDSKEPASPTDGFAIKSIEIGEFAIQNGTLRIVDKQAGWQKEIKDLTFKLNDVSLDRPIKLLFSALVDGKSIGLSGTFGPIGSSPGTGTLPLDFTLSALGQIKANLSGRITDPITHLGYELAIEIQEFSPRQVMDMLGIQFPVQTSDERALDSVALGLKVAGGVNSIALSNGRVQVDDSTFDFKGDVKNFTPLNLVFEGNLDAIDLDRYLPPKKEEEETAATPKAAGEQKPIDYTPLRKLSIDSTFRIGELRVQGGKVENIVIKLAADGGVFRLNPVSMDLYNGKVDSTVTVDVTGEVPATALEFTTTSLQSGPMLKDFTQKDVLEGTMQSNVTLTMRGDTADVVKKTLNGQGEFLFQDGAIVGIDLAGMVRNVQASFGLAEKPEEKPRTDFAELRAPFTLKNGLFNTPGTTLQSPLIRVSAMGSANLVSEKLDMRVRPKFVATLKGQGDTVQRSGIMVPVLVQGTFSEPKFSPDLEGMVRSQVERQLLDSKGLQESLEKELSSDKVAPKDGKEEIKKTIKGLIPKFPFN